MPEHIGSLIPKFRRVVLVGHDIRNDLHALYLINFKFPISIVGILDTFRIARELNVTASSLNDLLQVFQCPYNDRHCGGNDAHFTLRVLLLLAIKSCTNDGIQCSSRLTILEDIAYSSIPYRTDAHVKAAKAAESKAKRLQLTRRHQSKLWDAEKQEEIRAKRAAKRLAAENEEPLYLFDLVGF